MGTIKQYNTNIIKYELPSYWFHLEFTNTASKLFLKCDLSL